jgi:hypothetical protein
LRVTSRDGHPVAVNVQIDDRPTVAPPHVLDDLAARLRVRRDLIEQVLAEGTRDELVAHLQSFTYAELRAPAYRP